MGKVNKICLKQKANIWNKLVGKTKIKQNNRKPNNLQQRAKLTPCEEGDWENNKNSRKVGLRCILEGQACGAIWPFPVPKLSYVL